MQYFLINSHLKHVIHLVEHLYCLKTCPEWASLQGKESSELFCLRWKIFWVSGCSPGESSWGGLEIRKRREALPTLWLKEGKEWNPNEEVGQCNIPFAERGEEFLRSRCLIVAFSVLQYGSIMPISTHSVCYF